jgi:hypothetical protein
MIVRLFVLQTGERKDVLATANLPKGVLSPHSEELPAPSNNHKDFLQTRVESNHHILFVNSHTAKQSNRMDGEEATRYLATASDVWEDVVFKTDALYNNQAPPPWVSFMIGGVSYRKMFLFLLLLLLLLQTGFTRNHHHQRPIDMLLTSSTPLLSYGTHPPRF